MRELARQIRAVTAPFVFGIPGGGSSLAVMDGLGREGARLFTTRFEGAAAVMAGTIGRLTGTPGVAVAIKGPGLANMVSGLALCKLESFPALAIAEAYTPATPMAKMHKRLDHETLTAAVVKARRFWSETGPDVGALAAHARAEIPGPVLLDLADAPIKDERALPPPSEANEASAEGLLERLNKAKRPVVIVGTFGIRAGWGRALSGLTIPVFTTAAAKGLIDETQPHAAGVYTGVGQELAPERMLLQDCDLVVGLGLRTNEVLAAGLPVDSIGVDSAGTSASPGFDFVEFGDTRCFEDVNSLLASRSWGLERLAHARARLDDRLAEGGFLPAAVYRAIERRFSGACRVVLDTGYFCTIGEHACCARTADRFLGSGQGRDMGTSLPMALAASIYDPAIPTAVAIGDGGIGMYVGELRLAVQHSLPLLTILMSDGGFGSIRGRAQKLGLTEEPLIVHEFGWCRAIDGLGIPSIRVENGGALERALASWDAKGPFFIEAGFDPTAYRMMVQGIRD